MAVFATDRLVVDRLLALRRPNGDWAEKEGEGREDDGFWPLLAVQLLWAMFMGGRCLSIGLRQRLGAGGPLDLTARA